VILNKKEKKITLPPCVIMAGGLGKRLGSLTKNTPKPIIKIKKIPYIIFLFNWLRKNGFKKFYIFTSYKKEKINKVIKNYFLKNKELKYKIFTDKKRSGTFKALSDQLRFLDNIFFYTNADEIANFNIKKMFTQFIKSKTGITCCVLKAKNGQISLNKKKGMIDKVCSKKKEKYIDCGYKFFSKKIFNKTKKSFSKIEHFLYNGYLKKEDISFFILKKLPLRIDTALDIKRTTKFLSE
jgi:NDP-sugar pyrophosphorylase family protein